MDYFNHSYCIIVFASGDCRTAASVNCFVLVYVLVEYDYLLQFTGLSTLVDVDESMNFRLSVKLFVKKWAVVCCCTHLWVRTKTLMQQYQHTFSAATKKTRGVPLSCRLDYQKETMKKTWGRHMPGGLLGAGLVNFKTQLDSVPHRSSVAKMKSSYNTWNNLQYHFKIRGLLLDFP